MTKLTDLIRIAEGLSPVNEGVFSWLSHDEDVPVMIGEDQVVLVDVVNKKVYRGGSGKNDGYDGYGRFGKEGADFYELLAKMNNLPKHHAERRLDGIEAEGQEGLVYPVIFTSKWNFEKSDKELLKEAEKYKDKQPKRDPNQGLAR